MTRHLFALLITLPDIGSGQPLPKTNSKLVLWVAQLTSSRRLSQQRSQSITVYRTSKADRAPDNLWNVN